MKITDQRTRRKMVMFGELPNGEWFLFRERLGFERLHLKMVVYKSPMNAIRIDSCAMTFFSPDMPVIPVNASVVLED